VDLPGGQVPNPTPRRSRLGLPFEIHVSRREGGDRSPVDSRARLRHHERQMGARRLALITVILAASLVAPQPAGAASAYDIQKVTTNVVLDDAVSFTFAPDGGIFYGERLSGEIRRYDPSTGSDAPFYDVPQIYGESGTELGLLGIALHPDYPDKPYVYAYATRRLEGVVRNQILRLTDDGGPVESLLIFGRRTSTTVTYHVGGRILFGPDGMLYVVVGDKGDSGNSQDLSSPWGKILRLTPTGRAPADNPFPDSRVYAFGIRNSFGFAFDPETGNLWETENGPECNDELNLFRPGANGAWGPHRTCSRPPPPPENTNQDGPLPRTLPLLWYTPTIGPTGAVFCDSCELDAAAEGRLLFGAVNTGEIIRVRLTADRLGVARQRVVYTHTRWVLSMERGDDGMIYFTDGSAIWRLVPGAG